MANVFGSPTATNASAAAAGAAAGSFVPGIGNVIGAGLGYLGGSIADWWSQKNQADYNAAAADKAWERQYQLQHEAWARDDNATQRKVADMKAAGINPMLAAGGGASNTSTSNVAPAQSYQRSQFSGANTAQTLMQARMNSLALEEVKSRINLNNANADAATTNAGTNSMNADTSRMDVNQRIDESIARTREISADAEVRRQVARRQGNLYEALRRRSAFDLEIEQVLRDSNIDMAKNRSRQSEYEADNAYANWAQNLRENEWSQQDRQYVLSVQEARLRDMGDVHAANEKQLEILIEDLKNYTENGIIPHGATSVENILRSEAEKLINNIKSVFGGAADAADWIRSRLPGPFKAAMDWLFPSM